MWPPSGTDDLATAGGIVAEPLTYELLTDVLCTVLAAVRAREQSGRVPLGRLARRR